MMMMDSCCPCTKSELDLWVKPSMQTTIDSGRWVEYSPVASIDGASTIEFFVPGTGDEYIDMANTVLQVCAKVVNADGSVLADGAEVAPINNFIDSLFSSVDLSLNDRLISPSNSTYGYRSYIEQLLSFGKDAKESYLTSCIWYKDDAGRFNITDDTNSGYRNRKHIFRQSREVEMMGRIHSDLFSQPRFLLSQVDMKVKLVRASDVFCLMAPAQNPEYKIRLTKISLFVRKAKLAPAVQLAHIKTLEKKPAIYPIKRVECKAFGIANGLRDVVQENLFLGQTPNRIVIGLVSNQGFNGDCTQNPFFFNHYNLNFLALYVDGKQIPSKPLQPNFDSGKFIRSYIGLFQSTGKYLTDAGNSITRGEFDRGYTLFGFDLTADLEGGAAHFQPNNLSGNVRLELKFSQPLPHSVNAVVYAEFNNVIHIDRNKNILIDYAA